jgi:hypothetical protein
MDSLRRMAVAPTSFPCEPAQPKTAKTRKPAAPAIVEFEVVNSERRPKACAVHVIGQARLDRGVGETIHGRW